MPTRHVHTVSGHADGSGGLTPRETLSHWPPEPTTAPAPQPSGSAASLGGSPANSPASCPASLLLSVEDSTTAATCS